MRDQLESELTRENIEIDHDGRARHFAYTVLSEQINRGKTPEAEISSIKSLAGLAIGQVAEHYKQQGFMVGIHAREMLDYSDPSATRRPTTAEYILRIDRYF